MYWMVHTSFFAYVIIVCILKFGFTGFFKEPNNEFLKIQYRINHSILSIWSDLTLIILFSLQNGIFIYVYLSISLIDMTELARLLKKKKLLFIEQIMEA